MALCFDQCSATADQGWGHVDEHVFILAGLDPVGLVVDAHRAVIADLAVEIRPCGKMLQVFGARIGFKVFE